MANEFMNSDRMFITMDMPQIATLPHRGITQMKLMPAKALAVNIHDICMLCIITHVVSMCSSK